MDVVSFEAISNDEWETAARASPDAWFWHTRLYSKFFMELHKDKNVHNLSFAIIDNSRILAICPVYLDHVDGVAQLGFANDSIPFPGLSDLLTQTERERVLTRYFVELKSFSSKYSASQVRINVSPLARNHVSNTLRPCSPLVRYGFLDLPAFTQVIHLRLDEKILWADVRKGHRADIRSAERLCEVVFWTKNTITPEVFAKYQKLHHKDAGRITRSQYSFDIMLEWIRTEQAVLVEATRGDKSLAFALIILFSDSAFYGSGCKDPDTIDLNASHLLQWKSMLWLKSSGFNFYEMGSQHFGPQWHHVATEKEMNISKYKRGFGGVTLPVHTGEFFYQASSLDRALTMRRDSFLETSNPTRDRLNGLTV